MLREAALLAVLSDFAGFVERPVEDADPFFLAMTRVRRRRASANGRTATALAVRQRRSIATAAHKMGSRWSHHRGHVG